jgi:uncharacterized membrane protein YbaN (DUF454 family)
MQTRFKRVLLLAAGWGFILLGIAGLFLPVLQGVLFILIGLTLLSTQYSWAHRLLARARHRFPKVGQTADRAAERASAWLRRISHRGGGD